MKLEKIVMRITVQIWLRFLQEKSKKRSFYTWGTLHLAKVGFRSKFRRHPGEAEIRVAARRGVNVVWRKVNFEQLLSSVQTCQKLWKIRKIVATPGITY